MPTFPNNRQLISTDMPGTSINPAAAGAIEEAVTGVGRQVFATTLPMVQQLKEAEARDAASRAHSEDMLASEEFATQLKLQSPDGYLTDEKGGYRTNADGTRRTLSQEYADWANERYQRNQETMPTQLAQTMYQERAQGWYTEQIIRVRNEENVRKTQAFDVMVTDNLQKFSDNLVSVPEVNKVYQFSNSLTEDVMGQVGRILPAPAAKEKILKANQQLAESTMEGAFNQVLAGVKGGDKSYNRTGIVSYWRGVLRGTDQTSLERKRQGLPTISDMLDPDRKATLDAQFIRLADHAKDLDISDLRRQVSDAKAAYEQGKGSRVPIQHLNQLIDAAVADKKITAFEAASDYKAGLAGAREIGKLNGTKFPLLTPSERAEEAKRSASQGYSAAQAYVAGAEGGKTAGSSVQQQVESTVMGYHERLLSQETSDFAAYLENYDPASRAALSKLDFTRPETFGQNRGNVQRALTQIDTYYARHFPSDPQFKRLISKDNSKLLATALTNKGLSTEQSSQAVKSLVAAYGDRYPEVMDQLIKDGNLTEDWRFAAVQPGSLGTEDVVGALKGRNETFEKNFKAFAEGQGVKEQDFDLAVSQQVGPFIQVMSQQSPNDPRNADQINTLKNTVKNKAMQLYVNTPSLSPSEAAKRAAKSLIFDHYHLAEVGGTGGFLGFGVKGEKNLLMIPRRSGTLQINDLEKQRIVTFAESHLDAKMLKSTGILPPPAAGGKPGQFDEKFYDQAANTGRFTLSRDQRGLNFWYRDATSGRYLQTFVKNSKGQIVPYFVTLEQALNTRTSEPKKLPLFQPGGQ